MRTLQEQGRNWMVGGILNRTSIVCYLMIEDLGGEVTRLIVMGSLTNTKPSLFVTW